MARIKSACELALEKTEDLNVDLDKISKEKSIKFGRKICGLYINDIDFTKEKFLSEYEKEDDKKSLREGIANNILINLSLPSDQMYNTTIDKIIEIIQMIKSDNEQLVATINQIREFFKQYLNHQNELVNQMKEQFAPALKQKEEQLKQQYGPDFTYSAEQDKDFMKLLDENLKKLDDQYNQTLIDVKEKIKEELL